jgi:hypothetical protein
MFGLSIVGVIHTVLSLVALATLITAFVREGRLTSTRPIGRVSLVTTALAALTSLVIFRHGGPGPAHGLAVLSLIAVIAAFGFARMKAFVGEAIAAGLTLLFHLIPGVTETLVRVPTSQPFATSPEDPALRPVYGVVLVISLIVLALQVRAARSTEPSAVRV